MARGRGSMRRVYSAPRMSNTPNRGNIPGKQLRIWQQNLNRSSDAQLDLLHQLWPDKYNIAVTQEPHINYLGNAQATPHWITVYPNGHLDRHQKTRALIMMNRLTILSNAWTQLDIDSPDVVGVQIAGEQGTLRIINIYNDCTHDKSMEAVEKYMTAARRQQGGERTPIKYVWMGDFNRHSPMWDDGRNVHLFTTQNLEAAGRLTAMVSS